MRATYGDPPCFYYVLVVDIIGVVIAVVVIIVVGTVVVIVIVVVFVVVVVDWKMTAIEDCKNGLLTPLFQTHGSDGCRLATSFPTSSLVSLFRDLHVDYLMSTARKFTPGFTQRSEQCSLPCCAHFRFPKCVQQGRGYR